MTVFSQKYRDVFGEKFPLPLVDLVLLGPAAKVPLIGLVDSGAYRPIFSEKFAELAGIDLSKTWQEEIQYGDGGPVTANIAPVRIGLVTNGPELPGLELQTSVAFVERLKLPYALLGRTGFFDRFSEVAFIRERPKNRFELRR